MIIEVAQVECWTAKCEVPLIKIFFGELDPVGFKVCNGYSRNGRELFAGTGW